MIVNTKNGNDYKKEFIEMILKSADYFKILFGEKVYFILEKLFASRKNLFSYEHCYIIKADDGKTASMVLCYDYKNKQTENIRTGWLIFRFLNIKFLKNLRLFIQLNKTVGQLSIGDFYISNIATFEKYKRKGFAKKLLTECEKIAKQKNAQRIILDVEKENINAINLYKSLQYKIEQEFAIKNKKINLNLYRMIKKIR